MNIYLYIKTHNITGLKYLGKTTKDPFKYSGSGKHWVRHIKKHGNNVTTEIIFQTDDRQIFKEYALEYSILHNIVESTLWANLMMETGTGGSNPNASTPESIEKAKQTRIKNNKKWTQSEDSNKKRSVSHTGRKKSLESIQKSIDVRKKNGTFNNVSWTKESHPEYAQKVSDALSGKPKTDEHKANMRFRVQDTTILVCPHCGRSGDYKNMKRWHMDRCKKNVAREIDLDAGKVCCILCHAEALLSPNFYQYHGLNCIYAYDHNPR